MKHATATVSSRRGNILRLDGCSLAALGVRPGARVRIGHLEDPTRTPWEFVVQTGGAAELGEAHVKPPDWLAVGTPIVIDVEPPRVQAARERREIVLRDALAPEHVPSGEVLAIGVDVTWWGGSPVDPSSQTETIAWARRDAWGTFRELGFERVDLRPAATRDPDDGVANADADAALLFHRLMAVIAQHASTPVVLALDAPLLAHPRRELPPRARRYPREVGDEQADTSDALAKLLDAKKLAFRACETAVHEQVARSRTHWRSIYLQPGAPIPPRIAALVETMRRSGFAMYEGPGAALAPRVVLECFPNEALWATEVLTNAFNDFTFRQARLYKRLGELSDVWPRSVLRAVVRECLGPVAAIAGLTDPKPLFEALDAFMDRDPLVALGPRARRVGKLFDDAIDSVVALLTAIAFANGRAHVHMGAPTDGHIVGPGSSHPGRGPL